MKNLKSYLTILLMLCASTIIVACHKDTMVSISQDDIYNKLYLFPTPPSTWLTAADGSTYYSSGYIGDVMPYYENGKFHIYYLHDGDATAAGFHPIHQFETSDFKSYVYDGKMIPFGNTNTQDQAIGTGSVVKVGSTYYFYYTGHNGTDGWILSNPMERIMYATSTDMKTWTKHDYLLGAPSGYDQNDFRDPYVFFNSQTNEYWMLVAARVNNKAVITYFTSTGPTTDNWVHKGDLYTTDDDSYYMLECPDVFQIGSKWYLVFSENQTQKTTHYRIANALTGPWTTPTVDVFDGEYFYAAKTASDGTNRYLFGWSYRKGDNSDNGDKTWGGNLIVDQLVQNSDGTLSTFTPTAISGQLTKGITLTQVDSTKISPSNNDYAVASGKNVLFTTITGQRKLTTTISGLQSGTETGFKFGVGYASAATYYKVKFKDGIASIVRVQDGTSESTEAQVPFAFTSGADINIEIVFDNSNFVININQKTTLTGRIYSINTVKWGLYAIGGNTTFKQLQLFGY